MSKKSRKKLIVGVICRTKESQNHIFMAEQLASRINFLFRHSLLPINTIGETKPVEFAELIDKSSILIIEKEEEAEKTALLLKDILKREPGKKVMVMSEVFSKSEKGILMSSGARFLLARPLSDEVLRRSIETCITAIEIEWWSVGGKEL